MGNSQVEALFWNGECFLRKWRWGLFFGDWIMRRNLLKKKRSTEDTVWLFRIRAEKRMLEACAMKRVGRNSYGRSQKPKAINFSLMDYFFVRTTGVERRKVRERRKWSEKYLSGNTAVHYYSSVCVCVLVSCFYDHSFLPVVCLPCARSTACEKLPSRKTCFWCYLVLWWITEN